MAGYPEDVTVERGEELPNITPQRSSINTSYLSLTLNEVPHYSENEGSDDENQQVSNGDSHPKMRLVVRTAIGLLLFGVVLGCVTFSKLTLIHLTDKLRNLTMNVTVTSKEVSLYLGVNDQTSDTS